VEFEPAIAVYGRLTIMWPLKRFATDIALMMMMVMMIMMMKMMTMMMIIIIIII
jgi:hypothetical protein